MNSWRVCWHFTLQPFWIEASMLLWIGVRSTVPALYWNQSVLMVINCTHEKKFGDPSCPQEKGKWCSTVSGEGIWCSTVFRRRIWCSTVLKRRALVIYWSQEKKTGAILFSGERNSCSSDLRRRKLVLHCFQEKGTGALLFSWEGNWCSTDCRRRKLVLYCFQENETGGALLFSRRMTLVYYCLRRRKQVLYCFRIREQVHYCYQEKETGALLFWVEGIWCSTVLSRRKLVHYYSTQVEGNRSSTAHLFMRRGLVLNCSRDKGVRAVMYSREREWCWTKFTV